MYRYQGEKRKSILTLQHGTPVLRLFYNFDPLACSTRRAIFQVFLFREVRVLPQKQTSSSEQECDDVLTGRPLAVTLFDSQLFHPKSRPRRRKRRSLCGRYHSRTKTFSSSMRSYLHSHTHEGRGRRVRDDLITNMPLRSISARLASRPERTSTAPCLKNRDSSNFAKAVACRNKQPTKCHR